ncbi:MAG: TetR/AcrR family transcriptional regulator [Saprospiraceae bacterium]
MPIQKTNRAEILYRAAGLFRRQGYFNTSMSDLAKECGLYKGSFYHYFPSKESILFEIVRESSHYLHQQVFIIAYDETLTPKDRLHVFLKKISAELFEQGGACLIGKTTFESANYDSELSVLLKGIFDGWIAALTYIYGKHHYEDKAKRFALQTIMELEGAGMLAQIYKEEDILQDAHGRAMMRLTID